MSIPDWEQASNRPPTRVLYGQLLDQPPAGLIVSTKIIGIDEKTPSFASRTLKDTCSRLCLFKLNMLTDGSLAATIRFKYLGPIMDGASGVYMGYDIAETGKLCYVYVEMSSFHPGQVLDKIILLPFPTADSRLVEFGVYMDIPGLIEDSKPLALYQILNIAIKSKDQVESSWTIDDVRVIERGSSPDYDKRLVWKWSGSDYLDPAFLPWSRITGPFSYFEVIVGGKELGQAYCTEFPIHRGDFDGCKGEGMEVVIRGRTFGGSKIASLPLQLSRDEIGVL